MTGDACRRPLMQIDFYGERLEGCVTCNLWRAALEREWRELPESDIEALRSLPRQRLGSLG